MISAHLTTVRRLMAAFAVLASYGFLIPRAHALTLQDAVRGRILLDVERRGEAWYVTPDVVERSYLGSPQNAFRVLRDHGLGITDENLRRIPVAAPGTFGEDIDADGLPDAFESAIGTSVLHADSDFDGRTDGEEVAAGTSPLGGSIVIDRTLVTRLSGKILLQVEGKGEAWYVHPVDGRRHYLGRPDDALRVMRQTALGISMENLDRVPVAAESTHTVIHSVPFAAQAPLGDWSSPRQADACEEASVLMAMAWVNGVSIDLGEAEREIMMMSDWERNNWGYFEDTSIEDTADRLFKGWYGYDRVEVRKNIGVSDIYGALADGNLVVVGVNAQLLSNPYFRYPAPIRHMILITGYDADRGEFIVNEPGTARGAGWRYSRQNLADALRDYDSGRWLPLPEHRTAMIVVKPRE